MKSNKVGEKIQTFAFILFWVAVILIVIINIIGIISSISSYSMAMENMDAYGNPGARIVLLIATCLLEILGAYLSYLILTGFGRLVENSEITRRYIRKLEKKEKQPKLDEK